jgi:ribosomal protein S6E (S10)
MIDGMTMDEIVEMAYSEYSSKLPNAAELEIKIGSDDGGRLMEFVVYGQENAKILREDLPPNYNKMRTVVIYRYDREPDLEDLSY